MKLIQYSRILILVILAGCSDKFNDPNIDYRIEFQSLLSSFEEASILSFDKVEVQDNKFYLNYLEELDPQKIYFLKKDLSIIRNDSPTKIYDNLRSIITLFYERYEETLRIRKDLLWFHKFNFEKDEYITVKRTEYFSTISEKQEFNRKILKNLIINEMLDDKDLESVVDELRRTYKDRISSLKKLRASDKFGVLANNFLSLIDPHAQYFSERDLENWNLRMNLSFEGIGAVLSYENEFAKIEELMPGGPAVTSNQISIGDRVIGVGQGEEGRIIRVVGWRLDDIVDKIRGEEGTFVQLKIQNNSGTSIVKLKRGKVLLEESDASSKIFEKGIHKLGYINLPSFYSDTECLNLGNPYTCKSAGNDVRKILIDFNSKQVNGLVIDLRNNGGGFLYEADLLTRLFINAGPTVQIKGSNNEVDVYSTWSTRRAWSKPVVVLVNKFSASASEIFAGALQDYKRALIVGQGTFGKGSVQRFERTKNGQFKFTDSLYYRVNGKPTQIYGVTPDLELPALLDAKEYGEQKYKNALKPSSIESTVFYKFNNEWTPTITEKHQARITSSDFYNLLSEIKSENESNEEVSLLFNERILIENARKNRNLGLANLRREIAGQPKFESYQDFLDFESDGIVLDEEIDQSLQALIDIIEDKKT